MHGGDNDPGLDLPVQQPKPDCQKSAAYVREPPDVAWESSQAEDARQLSHPPFLPLVMNRFAHAARVPHTLASQLYSGTKIMAVHKP